MDQFELRTHKRLIDMEPTVQTVDELKKLNLPVGVEINISLNITNPFKAGLLKTLSPAN